MFIWIFAFSLIFRYQFTHKFFPSLLSIKFLISSGFRFQFYNSMNNFFLLSFNFTLWSARTAKSTILKVLFFDDDYYKVRGSGWDLVICLYLNITEEFVLLILQDRFWVVQIPFGCMVKFKFLAQLLIIIITIIIWEENNSMCILND